MSGLKKNSLINFDIPRYYCSVLSHHNSERIKIHMGDDAASCIIVVWSSLLERNNDFNLLRGILIPTYRKMYFNSVSRIPYFNFLLRSSRMSPQIMSKLVPFCAMIDVM